MPFLVCSPGTSFSFSTNPAKLACSISTGWFAWSYRFTVKWKKFDFLRLVGGGFSKWARSSWTLENVLLFDWTDLLCCFIGWFRLILKDRIQKILNLKNCICGNIIFLLSVETSRNLQWTNETFECRRPWDRPWAYLGYRSVCSGSKGLGEDQLHTQKALNGGGPKH